MLLMNKRLLNNISKCQPQALSWDMAEVGQITGTQLHKYTSLELLKEIEFSD